MSNLRNRTNNRTRIADIEATMAGVPKPWLIMEKWVRCLWMAGSSRGWGRVLHSGLRSWFRRSISSLQINLQQSYNQHNFRDILFRER